MGQTSTTIAGSRSDVSQSRIPPFALQLEPSSGEGCAGGSPAVRNFAVWSAARTPNSRSRISARIGNHGAGFTGFANFEPALGGKWLELLSEIAPGLKRAAIMFNSDTTVTSAFRPLIVEAARSLKVMPIPAPVRNDVEIEAAIIALGREPGGGLAVMPQEFTLGHRAPIISAAARHNVPAVYGLPYFARDGGLLSYGADPADNVRRAASYVDRILRDEKPGDLPVQFPTKFEMVLNLKTARALGLDVSPALLARADEVIE